MKEADWREEREGLPPDSLSRFTVKGRVLGASSSRARPDTCRPDEFYAAPGEPQEVPRRADMPSANAQEKLQEIAGEASEGLLETWDVGQPEKAVKQALDGWHGDSCQEGRQNGRVAESQEGGASVLQGSAGPKSADIEMACRQTFIFGNQKAGMDLTEEERAKIAAKIFELSRHSPFYANEMRKSRQLDEQIAALRRRQQLFLSSGGYAAAAATARRVMHQLEQRRQQGAGRVYVHLDMDMFFCAVEMRDDPSLVSVPMAVGSLSMLSTANYAARRYGVRSAMPGFIAKKLCPSLVIIRPNFKKYRQAGAVIRQVLETYDPGLSSHSLDEASLDVTEFIRQREKLEAAAAASRTNMPSGVPTAAEQSGTKAQAAGEKGEAANRIAALVFEIRAAVSAATGLSCSAGAAPSRLVAKIASDVNKPNGQLIVISTPTASAASASGATSGAAEAAEMSCSSAAAAAPESSFSGGAAREVEALGPFLESLSVRKLPGVGKHREKLLHALNIHTCGQLVQQAPLLLHLLPRVTAMHLLRLALGIDGSDQQPPHQHQQQSISSEETFQATDELLVLLRVVEELATGVADQLRDMRQETDHVSVKVKFADFSVKTISRRLTTHTDDPQMIATAAQALLQSVVREQQLKKSSSSSSNSSSNGSTSVQQKGTGTFVRLLGVRCAGLRDLKPKSRAIRKLDEFFPQQQQQQQPSAVEAATETAEERDCRIEVNELDDLLAVLSQQHHAPHVSEGPADPSAAEEESAFAAAAAPSSVRAEPAVGDTPAILKCEPHNRDMEAPVVAGASGSEESVCDVETATATSRSCSRQRSNKHRSSSRNSKTSGSSSKQLLLQLPPQHQHQRQQTQRRRWPSPPIHRQLKQQKRMQAAHRQQQQWLALFKAARRPQQQQRRRRQTAHPAEPEVVEIGSD